MRAASAPTASSRPYESLARRHAAPTCSSARARRPTVFVRFSTVAGSKGSADLARDVRGFAVKFYTQEGNWDLVGNNIPVFFIQDAIKFPDLIHAAKQEPDRGFPQAQTAHDNFWDFISLTPESMHMVMWIMSDRTIPRSFRFMEGFGVHTFRLVNAEGKSTFVKFHWKPKLGLQSVVWNEAVKINGADPDFHRRDLWDAIESGDFPEWELGLQLFDEEFADEFDFDVLDATKIIPEEDVPVRRVGRLVLDRNVDNFFAETEQVAFCTQNIVPGIDFTNDPLLQGRNFSYLDTQLKRLGGPNFTASADQRAEVPVRTTSSRTATWRCTTRRAAPTTSRTPGARRAARANRPSAASAPSRRGDRGSEAARARRRASPTTTARRGSSIISQTEVEQHAHRGRLRLRAEQGRDARDPRAHGRAPAQHRRRPGANGGRGPAAAARCPKPADAGAAGRDRPQAVAGAQHPQQRAELDSRAASSARWSPTASTRTLLAALKGAVKAEGAMLEARRAEGRRRRG